MSAFHGQFTLFRLLILCFTVVFRPSARTPHTGSGSWQVHPASAGTEAGECGQAGRSSQEILALWSTTGPSEFIWASLISLEKMGSRRR